MATKKFDFNSAYQDLTEGTREALVNARLKPEQLQKMADGEILSIEGIKEASLEEIRAKFPITLPTSNDESSKVEVEESSKDVSLSPRNRYPRRLHGRSKAYKTKAKLQDKSPKALLAAVNLLRTLSYSKHKTVELHLNVRETGLRGEVGLPYSAGKSKTVAIFTPELATKIKTGKIEFDILLATPKDMPQVAPLAKILGPKGLMPNPKTNTVTDNPEKRKLELEQGGLLSYRSEPKAPLVHTVVGSLDQKDEEIAANLKALILHVGLNKIKSAYIKTTMSKSVSLIITDLK